MKTHTPLEMARQHAALDARSTAETTRPRERSTCSAPPPLGRIYAALKNRDAPKEQRRCIGNKLRFFERCRATRIATPPILMLLDRGNFLLLEHDDGELPPIDLFIEPVRDTRGHGAEFWHCNGHSWTRGRDWLDHDALLERALARSRHGAIIIQPALRAHPALMPLSHGALSTARVITTVNEHGRIELAGAAFGMSVRSAATVDAFRAGGIAATIDLGTGRLGLATDVGPANHNAWYERHPVTDAPIADVVLPHWQQAASLVCTAHTQMNERAKIGWDVAILEDGPVLLGGNGRPDLDLLRRTQR